jgi:hypothetical protein
MSSYSAAIDDACDKRARDVGRDLNADEVEEVEDKLFRSWIVTRRFEELIEYAAEEFELQDGEAFCASLGHALCKANEAALARQLFGGLAHKREAAFWRVWPKAQLGHVGAMKESSRHLANAMAALAELYRCCAALDDEPGQRQAKDEMRRLQERREREA